MNKVEIRREVRARKGLLTPEQREASAARVFDRVKNLDAFIDAHHILAYHSLPDELSTISFLAETFPGKTFYLPRVKGDDLEILRYAADALHQGAYNIEEPDGDDIVDISAIDLVIVPAVAYDRHGNRVGRGKGYYDRLLSRSTAKKIGVCYDFQLYDTVPADPTDIPVDIIIADGNETINCR